MVLNDKDLADIVCCEIYQNLADRGIDTRGRFWDRKTRKAFSREFSRVYRKYKPLPRPQVIIIVVDTVSVLFSIAALVMALLRLQSPG